MKKLIVSVIVCMLITGILTAEDTTESKKSDIKFSTNINTVLAFPWRAKVTATEVIKVPFLVRNNPFMRGNNITFKIGAELSPITLEGKFDIVWTPLAFLELYGGASIGSGWTISKLGFHGLSYNKPNAQGRSEIIPVNFRSVFYSANFGATFQFDLGAIIPSPWTHVVFKTDQYMVYRGLAGAKSTDSWIFQNDDGWNRNGFTYNGMYVLGYQMPLPIKLVALRIETYKTFFPTASGVDKRTWGEDRFYVVFGPLVAFKPADICTITLVAQWETKRNYINKTSPDKFSQFYQTLQINTANPDSVHFYQVGVIVDINLPNT